MKNEKTKFLFGKETLDENSGEIIMENVDAPEIKMTYLKKELLIWNENVSKNDY